MSNITELNKRFVSSLVNSTTVAPTTARRNDTEWAAARRGPSQQWWDKDHFPADILNRRLLEIDSTMQQTVVLANSMVMNGGSTTSGAMNQDMNVPMWWSRPTSQATDNGAKQVMHTFDCLMGEKSAIHSALSAKGVKNESKLPEDDAKKLVTDTVDVLSSQFENLEYNEGDDSSDSDSESSSDEDHVDENFDQALLSQPWWATGMLPEPTAGGSFEQTTTSLQRARDRVHEEYLQRRIRGRRSRRHRRGRHGRRRHGRRHHSRRYSRGWGNPWGGYGWGGYGYPGYPHRDYFPWWGQNTHGNDPAWVAESVCHDIWTKARMQDPANTPSWQVYRISSCDLPSATYGAYGYM